MTDYTALWNRVAVNGWAHTIRELVAAHDVQRRELQAENTRLVIENRDLRAERDDIKARLDRPESKPVTEIHFVPVTPDYSALGDGAWFDLPGNER